MINATVLPSGDLKLTACNETRSDIVRWMRDGRDRWTIFADLFESYSCNGSFTPFDASDGDPFVGLSSAPGIAEAMTVEDDGARAIDGRFWYFGDYMIRDELEELARRGRVVFTLARESVA